MLPTLAVSQFSTNINLLLQIKGSMLSSCVTHGSYVGKQASPLDQVGSVEAQKVTSRFAPKGRVDATFDRRWVLPTDYDLPQLVDNFDQLRTINDVKSSYTQNVVNAMGRAKDDEIILGMFGANKTGETGATNTVFGAGNVIGLNTGGTNTNLNVDKIRAAKLKLLQNFVDPTMDQIYMAIDAQNHDALLNEIQIISSDFNGGDRPVLKDGVVSRFLGVNFVLCERLRTKALGLDDQSTSASSIQLPMWAQSGVHLGTWSDVNVTVKQRYDLQGDPWEIYAMGTFGACRTEENKIVKVWAKA